jgi:cytochrome c553
VPLLHLSPGNAFVHEKLGGVVMNSGLTVAVLAILAFSAGDVLAAGDAAAGESRAAACAACHQPGAFAGKSEAVLTARIQAIAAGKSAHPPLGSLSADDVANIAAFYAATTTD